VQSVDRHDVEDLLARLRTRFPTERYVDLALSEKMRQRTDLPYQPQVLEQVVARLRAFLEQRLPGPVTVSEVKGLAGGSSKEQFAFRLQWQDRNGVAMDERLVLRMRPAESIVETHGLREFQAIEAVRGVLPVPTLRWIDPDGAELGRPAIIYAFMHGVSKPPFDGAYTPKNHFSQRYRQLLYPQFVEYFAELGRLDCPAAALPAFDRPPAGTNEGVLAAINWWQRVWVEDSVEAFPLLTLTADWLRRNAPAIDHVSLVHSDFRPGNFLFDPESARITAFLDWELALLGDRHMDLAYFMSPVFSRVDEESGEELLGGLVTRARFVEDYERLSGLSVDQKRLDYYSVFNSWRGAIISMATAPRIAMGQKSHQDIRVGWIAGTAPLSCNEIHRQLSGLQS
jgi:aminoglycoside phosphotransferase (APT) family kinase protein